MNKAAWTMLVNETMQHVLDNPVEYIGSDLPHQQLIKDVLDEIRTEFLKESNTLLAVPRH